MSKFKVHLSNKEVTVKSEYGSITSDRSEHLESQVAQLRDKLLANEKEADRLTEYLNPKCAENDTSHKVSPPSAFPPKFSK